MDNGNYPWEIALTVSLTANIVCIVDNHKSTLQNKILSAFKDLTSADRSVSLELKSQANVSIVGFGINPKILPDDWSL